jgi:hypothetical protein
MAATTTRFSPESKAEDITEVIFPGNLKIWTRKRYGEGSRGFFEIRTA